MVKNDVRQRSVFWNTLASKITAKGLDEYYIVLENKKGNWYKNVSSKAFFSRYSGHQFEISLSCATSNRNESAVPRILFIFHDGEDETNMLQLKKLLKNTFTDLKITSTHTNDDGCSKIEIRRRMNAGARVTPEQEAVILVDNLEVLTNYLLTL